MQYVYICIYPNIYPTYVYICIYLNIYLCTSRVLMSVSVDVGELVYFRRATVCNICICVYI